MAVKKGDKVKVDYTGTLDDGTVFDSSEGKEPLKFEVGSGHIIKGFDDALVGMEKGDEKQIKIESSKAYGEPNVQLIKKVPKEHFKLDQEPKKGMSVALATQEGQHIPARITDVSENEVTLDLNHPLAGKNLNFKIKLVDVEA